MQNRRLAGLAILMLVVANPLSLASSPHGTLTTYAQTISSTPSGDEFNNPQFTAPFKQFCGSLAGGVCPDLTGATTWSLNNQASGALRIWTQAGTDEGTANNGRNLFLQSNIDPNSSWTITTQITFPAATNGTDTLGQTAGIIAMQDQDNFIFVGRIFQPGTSTPSLQFVQEVAGVDTVATVQESSSTVYLSPLYLRLTKSGTIYTGYYSYDNATWTQFTSPAASYAASYTPLSVGLFAWGGTDTTADANLMAADFDWLRVGDSTVPATSSPATNTPIPSGTTTATATATPTRTPKPTPTSPVPTPTPQPATPTPTPVPHPQVSIWQIVTGYSGHASSSVYLRQPIDFAVRYHTQGISSGTTGHMTFAVSNHSGTLAQHTYNIRPNGNGVFGVTFSHSIIGKKNLKVTVQFGSLHATKWTSFTIFDPSSFGISYNAKAAPVRKLGAARVESDSQAQKDFLHLDTRSYAQEGRQSGFYEYEFLGWPNQGKNAAILQSDLISIYGTVQQAQSAFYAERQAYQMLKGCGSCGVAVAQIGPSKLAVGDACCGAIYASASKNGLIVELFFTRGTILVQDTVFWKGKLPTATEKQALGILVGAGYLLDHEAWLQQKL